MSVAAISASSVFDLSNQNVVSKRDSIQKEFQQLGQDLQSGDLTAAQSDFTTLQQLVPKLASISTAPATTTTSATSTTATSTVPTTTQSTDPRVQAFQQLEQDIQAGNTSAAQQDYSNIQQIFQADPPPTTITGCMKAESTARPADCSSYFSNWARNCNPAASPRRSRRLRPCNRILWRRTSPPAGRSRSRRRRPFRLRHSFAHGIDLLVDSPE